MENNRDIKNRDVEDVLGKAPVNKLHVLSTLAYMSFFSLLVAATFIPFTNSVSGQIELKYFNKITLKNNEMNEKDIPAKKEFVRGYMEIEDIFIPKGAKIKIVLDEFSNDVHEYIEGEIDTVFHNTRLNKMELLFSLRNDSFTNKKVDLEECKKNAGFASITYSSETLFDKIFTNIRKVNRKK